MCESFSVSLCVSLRVCVCDLYRPAHVYEYNRQEPIPRQRAGFVQSNCLPKFENASPETKDSDSKLIDVLQC